VSFVRNKTAMFGGQVGESNKASLCDLVFGVLRYPSSTPMVSIVAPTPGHYHYTVYSSHATTHNTYRHTNITSEKDFPT
jgi:hypothetical protein